MLLVGVVQRHDVGVVHARGGLRLAEKELHGAGMVPQALGHALQRDGPAKATVPRLVDEAHAAAADFFEDLVALFGDEGGRARRRREHRA